MQDTQHYRNKNRGIVKSWLKRAKRILEGQTPLFQDGTLPLESLQAMRLMAKMRELADEGGMGFAGYFVTKDGKYLIMTNVED